MKRIVTLLIAGLLAGCAVGPRFNPRPVATDSTRMGSPAARDSVRSFFDSLAVARTRDTVAAPSAELRPLAPEQIADLAWLDILRDTVLNRLVETALRQNRDLAMAEARIEEFRAQVGVARAGLFPRLTLNALPSKNQTAFGTQLVNFNALRFTADVAWELDFWGRIRRGMQAANADLAAQQAAERATVLSLVSDVA